MSVEDQPRAWGQVREEMFRGARSQSTTDSTNTSLNVSSASPIRQSSAAMQAARILQEAARSSSSVVNRQAGGGDDKPVLTHGDARQTTSSSNVVYESYSRSRASEIREVVPAPQQMEENPQQGRAPASPDVINDPFSPNKELYQAFMRSAADGHTKVMAERLMQQLSELSRKVSTLTTSLNVQTRQNTELTVRLTEAESRARNSGTPEEATLRDFLSAIRETSVQLAGHLSGSLRFPISPSSEQLNTTITTISTALEGCAKSVASCRRTALSMANDGSNHDGEGLDVILAALQRDRGDVRAKEASASALSAAAASERHTLSRVIDILGGDASKYATLDELREAAPAAATKARTTIEQTTRDYNAATVALREFERRSHQMLRACGVQVVPSAAELLDNGGVGGRTGFDSCMESAQWLSRAIQRAEMEFGVVPATTVGIADRLQAVLSATPKSTPAEQPSGTDVALRTTIVPLLSKPLPRDASSSDIIDAIAAALTEPRQSPRRQSSIVNIDVEQSDVLLGDILDEIDALATDKSHEWALLGQHVMVTVPSAPSQSTPSSTPRKGRRAVTHGDVSRAIGRLKDRLGLVTAAAIAAQEGDASSSTQRPQGYSIQSPSQDVAEQPRSVEEDAGGAHAAANQRALYALAQLIPKTTISGAVPTQQRAKGTTSSSGTVIPPTEDLDEMVQLISERLDQLHQGLQKAYKQSDTHRTERQRLEDLIHGRGPAIAKAMQQALSSIRNANAEEDTDNGDIEGFFVNGHLVSYALDTMDAAHTFGNYFEPMMADLAARAEALKTKAGRLSSNHRTDRQRIANYASSQATTLKRWQRAISEVINIARFVGIDTADLARMVGEEQSSSIRNGDAALPPNGASTTMCGDVLRKVMEKLQHGGLVDASMADAGAVQTELNDLREEATAAATQRRLFAETIRVMLRKLAEVGRGLKRCMYAFGPDDTDYDEVMEEVLAEGREATSEDDEEALGTIIKKLCKWSSRLDNVSSEHTASLQKVVRYFNGVHAVVCGAEAEVHDVNALDAGETLVRIADGLLMALNDGSAEARGIRRRIPEEVTAEGEGRFLGADQDHRLIRIHSVVTKLHQAMDALLKGRYLAIPGLMDEEAADRTSDASPSRAQTAFLDIDPETTALTTTELVRLIEQNLRHVDGCLSRFGIGHKQAAIYIQKDVDAMQAELASMLGYLSRLDVQDTFQIDRRDLKGLYDVLKDKPGQRGSYFFNRLDTGEGSAPWVTALGYLSQTYGPTVEMLAAKADSQRVLKRLVDKSMDEAAAYVQWCRDNDLALPKAITDSKVGEDEIELLDDHLPVVINYAANNAMGVLDAERTKAGAQLATEEAVRMQQDWHRQREGLTATIANLRSHVEELQVQRDALASEAAMARAQLRRMGHSDAEEYDKARRRDTHDQSYDAPQFKPAVPRVGRSHADPLATTPLRSSTPTRPLGDGYSSRPQVAKAPIPAPANGYASIRQSPSRRDEGLQAVASHPTVKEYVRALCNELEQRHKNSPQGTRNTTPARRNESPPSRPLQQSRRAERNLIGPNSYDPANRSNHHMQPIASANTCIATHTNSPDRHCRKSGCVETHRGSAEEPPKQRRSSKHSPPIEGLSGRRGFTNEIAGVDNRNVVMPRSVMIVGPRGGDEEHNVSSADSTSEVGRGFHRPIVGKGGADVGDHLDAMLSTGKGGAQLASSHTRLAAPNRSRSPRLPASDDGYAAREGRRGGVSAADGNGVVHVRNSEMPLLSSKRTPPVEPKRSSSSSRWRV